MKPLTLVAAFVASVAFAAPCAALTAQEGSYLRKLGIDPRSQAVVAAEAEGTIEIVFHSDLKKFSLSGLIAQGDVPNGVRAFIATRAFIARLKVDFAGTAIPEKDYDSMYLTREEKKLVARKIKSTL